MSSLASHGERLRPDSGHGVNVRPSLDGDVPRRLIATATSLFAHDGFENTSVQQIVDGAGVTKGSMYHYFDSKDEILFVIYARVLHLQMTHLERIANLDWDVVEKLRLAAVDVVETSVTNLSDFAVFWRSHGSLSPGYKARIAADQQRYHEMFKSLVVEGQKVGEFRADIEADIAVDFFFGAVHHVGTWYKPGGSLDGRSLGLRFAEMFISGVSPAGPFMLDAPQIDAEA